VFTPTTLMQKRWKTRSVDLLGRLPPRRLRIIYMT
jgi:hypothetical protein